MNPAWAQAAPGGAPAPLMNMLPLVLIFVVFYFMLIRPQQQKAKEHRAMLANLKRNDVVVTAGGLYGKVMALTEKIVTLEIAPNVRVQIDRPQISTLANDVKGSVADNGKDKEKDKVK